MSNALLAAGQTTALSLAYIGQQPAAATNFWRIQDSAGADIAPKLSIGSAGNSSSSEDGYTFDYLGSVPDNHVSAQLAVPAGAAASAVAITFYGLNGDTYSAVFDLGPAPPPAPGSIPPPTLTATGEIAGGVPAILLSVH